jgi:ABC-2 type transport system permease protein
MHSSHLLWAQTHALAHRLLLEQWRQKRGLIFWAVFPSTMMLLFGLVYAHNASMRAGLDAAAAGILVGAALFFSCLGGTVAVIAAERERGTLGRLLATPLHPAAYFLGVVIAQLLQALLQVVMLYSIALLIGAQYHGSLFLGGLILLLSVFSYVGMGFFLGARFARRSEEVVVALSAIGVPLLVLGGTFFPLEIMPQGMQALAHINPMLHMNQAFKGVAAYGMGFAELRFELGFLVVFCCLSLALGMHSYRHLLDVDKSP